jgi:transposase InsO family protein
MGIRRLIVEVDPSSLNVTEFCHLHGISTWFFYDLRRRHAVEGAAALEPKSRAPHRVANQTPTAVEEAIVAKRKELAEAGLDAGAETIAFHLRDLEGIPSPSTIWRILKARGFIDPQPGKAPKRKGHSFTAERANSSWQIDDTAWVLADETPVKILDVIDDHSRLAVAARVLRSCTGAVAVDTLVTAAQDLGLPARFQSDNAKTFRDVLAEAMAALGVAAAHSRPYHPQTNGKVERFHQTLKKWLARQPRAETTTELQHQCDLFRLIYNHHRPHRSLDRQHPADVWTRAPKDGPADRPLATPTRIYHGTVTGSRLDITGHYRITIGAAHDTQPALAVITGTNCHVFIDGHLVRSLTLNPNRRDQPLHNRPGRPRLP